MLGPMFRRLYSTAPPVIPHTAQVARTESTPLAVRIRRYEQTKEVIERGGTDATPEGLSPSQHARYLRLQKLGRVPKTLSPAAWIVRETAKRSRIRGTRTTVVNGEQKVDYVGQTIYLPNILFTLVRNHTLPDEPYNPYEATFRVPLNITKTDVRSYLKAAYGVDTTYIRTDVYRPASPKRGLEQTKKAYKRAVVGLVEPFYYPDRYEDMTADEKQVHDTKLEESWKIKEAKAETKVLGRRLKTDGHKKPVSYQEVSGRGKILALIAERRSKREKLVSDTLESWKTKRANKEVIALEPADSQVPSIDAPTSH